MTVTERARRADALYRDESMHRRALCERVAMLESMCGDLADVVATGGRPGVWARLKSELRLMGIGGR